MTARTPFESKELVATKNALRYAFSGRQFIRIRTDARWNLSADFTLSFAIKELSVVALVFQSDPAKTATFICYFVNNIEVIYQIKNDAGTTVQINSERLPTDINVGQVRLTVTRIGSTVSWYYNTKLLSSQTLSGSITLHHNDGDSVTFGAGQEAYKIPTTSHMDGYMSNIVLLNGKGMTRSELGEFHQTNTIPKSCHPYVVAHYPLNHDSDELAYDVVEQYNYAKHVAVNLSTVAASNFSFLSANGNTASKTDGSDGDGAYVEFEFTNKEDSPHLVIQPASASVIPALFKITLKFKFITGVTDNAFQFSIDDSSSVFFTEAAYGTTVKTISFSRVSLYAYSGNYNAYLAFSTSAGMHPEGSKFRLYSMVVTGILTANHADLINFANNDVGVPNLLSQTSWQNLYETKKKGQFFLKGNGVDMYAQIPSYTASNPATWSLYLEFSQSITNPFYSTIFCGGDTSNNKFGVFTVGATNLTIAYAVSYQLYNAAPSPNPGFLFYKVWIIHNGTQAWAIVNGLANVGSTVATIGFDFFRFFRQNSANELWSSDGNSRAVFFNREVTAHERNAVEGNLLEYKSFANLQFDLDFGDIFVQSGNYMIRDHSTNARHAQLYNYVPTTNQPLLYEQDNKIPPVSKALKFNSTNHHILVPTFNPTKEKGYTVIIQIKSLTTAFSGAKHLYYHSDGTRAKYMFGVSGTQTVRVSQAGTPSYQYDIDAKKTDTINTFHFTEIGTKHSFGMNGVVISESISGDTKGFDEIPGTLIIAGYTSGSNALDGYMMLFAIWKGVLTFREINSIINNNLGQNPPPALMADCQLYLNFDKIVTTTLIRKTFEIGGGYSVTNGSPILTLGSDADGYYLEMESNSTLVTITIPNTLAIPYIIGRKYWINYRVKLLNTPNSLEARMYDGGSGHFITFVHGEGLNVILTRHIEFTAVANGSPSFQFQYWDGSGGASGMKARIYLAEVVDQGTIKDWSPQNRVVALRNFSENEVNPAHASYRLVDTKTLRRSYITSPAFPTAVLSKVWAHYKCDTREQLEITTRGETAVWTNQQGTSSRQLVGYNDGSRIYSSLRRRRFKDTNIFLHESVIQEEGNRLVGMAQGSKNMDFMHNGGDWFVSLLYGGQSGMATYFWHVIVNTGAVCGGGAGCVGVHMMVNPGNGSLSVNIENNTGRAMTFATNSGTIPMDQLHLIIVNFDADAVSNNCKVYLDGSLTPLASSGASLSGSFNTSESSLMPNCFGFQANNDPKTCFYGEMIIGNALLEDSIDISDLKDYYIAKYGAFPQPL